MDTPSLVPADQVGPPAFYVSLAYSLPLAETVELISDYLSRVLLIHDCLLWLECFAVSQHEQQPRTEAHAEMIRVRDSELAGRARGGQNQFSFKF